MIRQILIALLFPSMLFAAPSKPVVGTITTSIPITGTSFGTKSPATPIYWNNYEAFSSGDTPTDWIVRAGTPGVSTVKAYSGTKSVGFVNTGSGFQQMSRDIGEATTIYYRGKNYVDHTANPCVSYQWKNLRFSSSPGAYDVSEEATTSIFLMDSWWRTAGWFNTGSPYSYYNSGTNGGSLSAPTALFPLDQWFDYQMVITRATAPNTADGTATITVNGAQKSTKTDFITHDEDDGIYRYMLMGGTVASCKNEAGDTINPNNRIYYDDTYIDNTLARVELCDNSTWASRTHCEIQPPTVWADDQITTTYNAGSFTNGSTAYLYVVDSTGAVSPASDAVTINGGQPSTAIVTPSKSPGRYTASQLLELTGGTVIKYCLVPGCTPTTTYTGGFKILQNVASHVLRTQADDGAVTEQIYKKQCRRSATCR